MSTGFFMGVRSSFREGTAPAAEAFLAAINQALSQNGSQPYRDPLQPPDVYNDSLFGRSELDNCSSETLAEVACLGSQSSTSTNLSLICDNPYRTCFIPAYLGIPIPTIYQERIGSQTITIWRLRNLLQFWEYRCNPMACWPTKQLKLLIGRINFWLKIARATLIGGRLGYVYIRV